MYYTMQRVTIVNEKGATVGKGKFTNDWVLAQWKKAPEFIEMLNLVFSRSRDDVHPQFTNCLKGHKAIRRLGSGRHVESKQWSRRIET